jgi:hypothetical protein
MSDTTTTQPTVQPMTEQDVLDALRDAELTAITSYTLADAMREGSTVTTQEYGWGSGGNACALSAARLAARARGYIA